MIEAIIYASGCLIIGFLLWLSGSNMFGAVLGAVGFLFGVLLMHLFQLISGSSVWPVVTICRSCNCRIFTWQKYYQADYNTIADCGGEFETTFQMFGLIHNSCEIPTATFGVYLTKKADQSPEIHFDDLILRPKEGLKGSVALPLMRENHND